MSRVAPSQTNFTAGELTPRLLGREDIDRYRNGAQTLENFLIMPHGGADKRPGTVFAHYAKHDDKKCRVIGFEYSVIETYVLEFGENYIRFFRNNGIITGTSETISGATQASPVVLTITGTTLNDGEEFFVNDIVGMTELNGRSFIATNTGANTTELYDRDGNPIDGLSYTAYSSGGTADHVYEITTPYIEDDLPTIHYVQSADVMYLFHPDHPVQKLSRTGHAAWTLTEVVFVDGPYRDENATTTTLAPAATSGTGVALVASANLFDSDHIGSTWRIKHGSTWGNFTITGVTDAQNATIDINATLGGTSAVTTWREGAFSAFRGYPKTGTFYEQRLVIGGNESEPQTFHGSVLNSFEDFSPDSSGSIEDDDSYGYTLASTNVQAIQWMVPARVLLTGTKSAEHKIGSETEAVTPTNINARRDTKHGSSGLMPVQVGNIVLFLQRSLRKVRELAFVFESDQYEAPDISILSEHITNGGVLDMSYAQEPDSIVWMVRRDGQLIGLTYERAQKVVAFHRTVINGKVESVSTIPKDGVSTEGYDETWITTKRRINGITRRFIEYFHERFDIAESVKEAFYVDAGLSLNVPTNINGASNTNPVVINFSDTHTFANGSQIDIDDMEGMTELNGLRFKVANVTATTAELTDLDDQPIDSSGYGLYDEGGCARQVVSVVSGLRHLAGETVKVVGNGANQPEKTVSAEGEITLETPASWVHVGIGYTSTLKTMPLTVGAQDGTTQGKTKGFGKIMARLYRTVGLNVGDDEIHFRSPDDLMDQPIEPFTGIKEIQSLGWDKEAEITIVHDLPLPCTILSIFGIAEVNDA